MKIERLKKQSLEVPPPSCLDCVACSVDCEIAVAIGDSVQLYIPKPDISNYKDEFEEHQWYKPRFVANTFDRQEFPSIEPLPANIFSIGEEQSVNKVIGLKWSPPGLANNNRCALAVLTSNHLLSIWAPRSNHDEDNDWERVLVVNRALNKYFTASRKAPVFCKNVPKKQQRSLQSRVRAFSWADSLMHMLSSKNDLLSFDDINGIFFVAVSNDAGELVIVRIHSCSNFNKISTMWTADVVNVITLPASATDAFNHEGYSDRLNEPPRFINHVAWSSWFIDGQQPPNLCHSKLAYIWNKCLFVISCKLTYSESNEVSLEVKSDQESFEGEQQGIIRWSRLNEGDTRTSLISVMRDKVQRISFSLNGSENSPSKISTENVDNTWSTYSGAAVSMDAKSTQNLHLALHSTASSLPGCDYKWKTESNAVQNQSKWVGTMQQHRAMFDKQHKLHGAVLSRVTGLDSFPGTDHLTACFTFHPSNAMEYAVASTSKATMVIRAQDLEDLDLTKLHNYRMIEIVGDLKVEASVFLIKRWLRYKESQDKDAQKYTEDLVTSLLSLAAKASTLPRVEEELTTVSKFIWYLRRRFNATGAFIKLVFQMVGCWEDLKDEERLGGLSHDRNDIASKLSKDITQLPNNLYKATKDDQRILELCKQLNAQINDTHAPERSTEPLEHCVICDEAISVESFTWARCRSGHRYPRCGFTFQSIQLPGFSKTCSFCNVPYFTRADLLADPESNRQKKPERNGDETMDEHRLSLTEILSCAFIVCIYCGGKFKG